MILWCFALLSSWALDDLLDTDASVFTLENGMTVVLEENHRTDQVAVHLHYGVGSRDELDGERGLAHLFEHLMFEGSENVPGSAFDEWLTSAGGSNNAFTTEDETAYHETFPSGALDLVLFMESDRLGYLQAGLTQENLDNQIDVVLQERARGYAERGGKTWDALSRLMYPPEHPYHVPVIGTVADIQGAKLTTVQEFFSRHYRPKNAVLGLVGHVNADQVKERLEWWFSDVPGPEVAEKRNRSIDVPRTPANGYLEDVYAKEAALYMAWRTVPLGHADQMALDVASWVLSDGRGTRLDDRLYYKSGLAVGDGVYSISQELDGQFVVFASTSRAPLARIQRVVLKVMSGLVKKPPTEAELHRAKQAIRSDLLNQMERPSERVEVLVDCVRQQNRPDCLRKDLELLDAVTADDVVGVVEKWLGPEAMVTLSVVPVDSQLQLDGAKRVELP